MSRRLVKLVTALLVAAISCSTLFACDKGGKVDTTKTQLYVANYDGGPGHAWLDEVKGRFEAEYANVSLEEGKIGVQVNVFNDKNLTVSSLASSSHEIYFMNNIMFNNHISQGDFVDISDMVKETIPGESESIEQKLSADTNAALTALNGGYYCLPSHQSLAGVTYNHHLFEAKGFFFADNPADCAMQDASNPTYGFIMEDSTIKKSTGPDALYGTDDDGLPSSIEEFKRLCDCMVYSNVTPFICYASSGHYTQMLLQTLWANLSGYNEAMLAVSFDSARYGTTDLVELDADGNVVKENGKIKVLKDQTINAENGYKITQQVSRYQALDFLEYIFNKSDIEAGKYLTKSSLSAALSHTDAQLDFMKSEVEPSADGVVGMLIEGNYWENESRDANNVQYVNDMYPEYTAEMDYRFMPMPTQYEGRVEAKGTVGENGVTEADGVKQTALDFLYYYSFLNAHALEKNPGKVAAAKKFLQFCYSDVSLQKSTLITGLTLDYEYELTSEQYASLTSYAKSVYDVKKNGNVIVPISNSPKFVKNMSTFKQGTLGSNVWATEQYLYPLTAFRDGCSLDNYFKLLCNEHDAAWWTGLN